MITSGRTKAAVVALSVLSFLLLCLRPSTAKHGKWYYVTAFHKSLCLQTDGHEMVHLGSCSHAEDSNHHLLWTTNGHGHIISKASGHCLDTMDEQETHHSLPHGKYYAAVMRPCKKLVKGEPYSDQQWYFQHKVHIRSKLHHQCLTIHHFGEDQLGVVGESHGAVISLPCRDGSQTQEWAAVDHNDHAFKTKHEFDETSNADLDFLDFHHEAELTADIQQHAYEDIGLLHEAGDDIGASSTHHEMADDSHHGANHGVGATSDHHVTDDAACNMHGKFDHDTGSCHCVPGWVGFHCDERDHTMAAHLGHHEANFERHERGETQPNHRSETKRFVKVHHRRHHHGRMGSGHGIVGGPALLQDGASHAAAASGVGHGEEDNIQPWNKHYRSSYGHFHHKVRQHSHILAWVLLIGIGFGVAVYYRNKSSRRGRRMF